MKNSHKNDKMGLWQAVAMAVGTMIGASIFSIFGIGAEIAGRNLPEAFLLSAVYAFVVAYSYAHLGVKIVSNAGPIAFILRGIGDNLMTGTLSILLWLTYVISVSMFSKGFAGYFIPLVNVEMNSFSESVVVVSVVVFFTALNFFGSRAVGRSELFIVVVKVTILCVFIAVGAAHIDFDSVVPSYSPVSMYGTLHASVIFFLSYMGFGLITNASENIDDPSRNIPRAIYLSIVIAMVIYCGVALAAIGNLPVDQIVREKENALAVAARPFLGNVGFLLISLGALFSTSSALNATLYGGANISYALARDGELPKFFERKKWFKSVEGLYITAALSILLALLFDMNGIASITSSIFTVLYLFVLFSHFKLRTEVGGRMSILIFNMVILLSIFAALMYFQWTSNIGGFFGTIVMFGGAMIAEVVYRFFRKRVFV